MPSASFESCDGASVVYLGLGSNVEPRKAFIGRALAALALLPGVRSVRSSECFFSEPMGFESDKGFVNIAARVVVERAAPWTLADAEALLDALEGIQRRIGPMPHRNTDGSYRDRQLDIDILMIDGLSFDSPRLTVPHPRMNGRPFVLVPLAELMNNA